MNYVIVPIPCKEEVEKYLNLWNNLPDYVAQESALNKLFFGDFKYNNISLTEYYNKYQVK